MDSSTPLRCSVAWEFNLFYLPQLLQDCRITGKFKLERPSGGLRLNLSLKQGQTWGQTRLLRTLSSQGLKSSWDEVATTPVGSFPPVPNCPHGEKAFPYIQTEPFLFQFMPAVLPSSCSSLLRVSCHLLENVPVGTAGCCSKSHPSRL